MSYPNKCRLNPYDEDRCRKLVTEKYEHLIKQKFGHYVHLCFKSIYEWEDIHSSTPRLRAISGQIPCATFYYTEFLIDVAPANIYDIGCGMNFFKDILPNVVGIDSVGNFDIKDIFDKTFVAGHEDRFTAAMSIDSLHFISLLNFSERVLDFARIIAPGGRGYLAMNAARMTENTDPHDLRILTNSIHPDAVLIAQYLDSEISKLPLEFLVAENLVDKRFDDFMDGNIRLVFQK